MLKRGFFALITLLLVFGAGAQALEREKIAAITRAADELVALAKDSAANGQVPRATDPRINALLTTVLDTSEIEKENAVPFAEIPLITEWNAAILKVFRLYLQAGTQGMNPQAAAQRSNENLIAFMPESGRIMDAMLWAQSAILDTAQSFLASATPQQLDNPNVKAGLGQIRAGAAQTLRGVLEVMALDGLTDAWREARLRAILALVPRSARTILPEERKFLHGLAQQVAGKLSAPAVKDAMQKVAAALQ